jgi:very-short-patch-repair endonuclease
VPIGRHIVDFLAPSARLVVEVDGGCHADRPLAHTLRDAALRRAGYTVLRLDAALVHYHLPEAVARIRAALLALPVET